MRYFITSTSISTSSGVDIRKISEFYKKNYRQRRPRWSYPAARLRWGSGQATASPCPTLSWWWCHHRPCRRARTPPWIQRFVPRSVDRPTNKKHNTNEWWNAFDCCACRLGERRPRALSTIQIGKVYTLACRVYGERSRTRRAKKQQSNRSIIHVHAHGVRATRNVKITTWTNRLDTWR